MNRRTFIKRGALCVPTIFIPRLIRAQSILTAEGLAAFGTNAPSGGGGGGGGNLTYILSGGGTATRHNFGGIVGSGLTANFNMTVKALTRKVVSGNSAVHRAYLLDVDGNTIIFGDIATSGVTAGTDARVAIADTALISGEQYFIMTTETNNGDDWVDDAIAIVTSADFTVAGSRFASGPNVGPSANTNGSFCFANAGFEYTKP